MNHFQISSNKDWFAYQNKLTIEAKLTLLSNYIRFDNLKTFEQRQTSKLENKEKRSFFQNLKYLTLSDLRKIDLWINSFDLCSFFFYLLILSISFIFIILLSACSVVIWFLVSEFKFGVQNMWDLKYRASFKYYSPGNAKPVHLFTIERWLIRFLMTSHDLNLKSWD